MFGTIIKAACAYGLFKTAQQAALIGQNSETNKGTHAVVAVGATVGCIALAASVVRDILPN